MLSRAEIKRVAKHLLKCFAWSVRLLLNPAQEKAGEDSQCAETPEFSPQKVLATSLNFESNYH